VAQDPSANLDEEMSDDLVKERCQVMSAYQDVTEKTIALYEKWQEECASRDEAIQAERKVLQDIISDVCPTLEARIAMTEAMNITLKHQLTEENLSLKLENRELKANAKHHLGTQEMTQRLQNFLDARQETV
jgi:uncharacterized FlgJ-related protein